MINTDHVFPSSLIFNACYVWVGLRVKCSTLVMYIEVFVVIKSSNGVI